MWPTVKNCQAVEQGGRAARASTLDIREVAARLDNVFDLLTRGRWTALPRHQTSQATLDWSYELLAEPERNGATHANPQAMDERLPGL
jgi:predicted ATPase